MTKAVVRAASGNKVVSFMFALFECNMVFLIKTLRKKDVERYPFYNLGGCLTRGFSEVVTLTKCGNVSLGQLCHKCSIAALCETLHMFSISFNG